MILLVLALSLMQSDVQRGTIAGVVMKAGTVLDQTLPNARLELTLGPGTPLVVRTDSAGRFAFSNLAPGRYRLAVTKDGFIRRQHGPLALKSGQQIRDIVFRLDQASTVTGWVQDTYGEPIAGAIVQALRRTYDIRGNRTLTVVASSATDDRGEYRIFWLDPGEYFFFVGSGTRGVAPTYYPGVSDPEGARPLRVEIGRELNGLNFQLRGAALITVSGYAAVTGGGPVASAIAVLPSAENPNPFRYESQSGPQGSFGFSKPLPPGSYIATGRTASGQRLRAFTRFSLRAVLAAYRYDLRLLFSPDIITSGRFFADTNALPDLPGTKVTLAPMEEGFPLPSTVSPQPDGEFSIPDVMPGAYTLSVSGLPGDLYVKAARRGAVDILETQLTVAGQSVPTPLQILLGSDGGRITAGVFDRQGLPSSDVQVVLVPGAGRRHRPDQYRTARTDENGRATIRGIPPGPYKLFAWETGEPNAYLNAEYLSAYEGFGVPVQVKSGENPPMAVRVIPADGG